MVPPAGLMKHMISLILTWLHRRLIQRRSARLALHGLGRVRRLALLALVLNLAVAACEGGSMAIFAGAIQSVLGTSGEDSLTVPGLETFRAGLGANASQAQMGIALLAAALLVQLCRAGLQFASEVVAVALATRITAAIRRRLFQAYLALGFEEFGRYKLGELTSYAEQADTVGIMVQLGTNLLTQGSMVLASLAVLCWLSWPMTLLTLLLLLLVAWPVRLLLGRVRLAGRELVRSRVGLSEASLELLQGFRVVQTFGLHANAQERIGEALDANARAARRSGFAQSLVRPVFETCAYLLGLSIFLIGYVAGGDASAVIGPMVAYSVVLYRLVPRVNHLNSFLPQIINSWPAWQSLSAFLSAAQAGQSSTRGLPPPPFNAICFDGVSFAYRETQRPAVHGLSFVIPTGRMTAIVGPSGAGKSTLLNLLLGFSRPDRGRVLLDGADLATLDLDAWRRQLGVVDQQGFLFHASVAVNIRCGKLDASDEEVAQAAAVAGAHEFIAQMPQGFNTVIGDRGHRLSGGQRQRLMIARAIIRQPRILVFDEATSSLDSQSERLIQEAVERLRGERTIVCIAHRLSTITAADQILVLDQGALIESGTHAELVRRNGTYARLWHLQAGADGSADQERAA